MMVQEATRLGYRALVVTVDAPRLGAIRHAGSRHAACRARILDRARRCWALMHFLTGRCKQPVYRKRRARADRAATLLHVLPPAGNREADERNRFSLPPHLSLKNLELITKAAATTEGVDTDGSKFGRQGVGGRVGHG